MTVILVSGAVVLGIGNRFDQAIGAEGRQHFVGLRRGAHACLNRKDLAGDVIVIAGDSIRAETVGAIGRAYRAVLEAAGTVRIGTES